MDYFMVFLSTFRIITGSGMIYFHLCFKKEQKTDDRIFFFEWNPKYSVGILMVTLIWKVKC